MTTLFISDIHLGASCIPDRRRHERMVCDFLADEGSKAARIFMLGDVLDYWYEYRNVVPRGFVRFFGILAALADKGVEITWMTGNHDIWLFDYLRDELGIEVVDAPWIKRTIDGTDFILAHGDRIGRGDFGFRLISNAFRNKVCQRLYASLHPRLTVPFAHRWSSSSRGSHDAEGRDEASMRGMIMRDAMRLADENPSAKYIVTGHHHIALDQPIAGHDARLVVLGDWIDKFTYGVFDGRDFSLLKYQKKD